MFEKYVKVLKENSIKITPQRLEILRYLDENRTHPTADQIYTGLKEKNPSLSKTTVYNSLEILGKHGIIQSLTISGSESRYDFKNLQESIVGFGNNTLEAMADLCKKLGYKPNKMWGASFKDLLK